MCSQKNTVSVRSSYWIPAQCPGLLPRLRNMVVAFPFSGSASIKLEHVPQSHTHRHTEDGRSHTVTDKLPSQHPHTGLTQAEAQTAKSPPPHGLLPQAPQNHKSPHMTAQTRDPSIFQLVETEDCQLITQHRHPHTHICTLIHGPREGTNTHPLQQLAAGTRAVTCSPTPDTGAPSHWSPSSWFSGQMSFP